MKKIIFLLFISLCFSTLLHADTEKELFDKGVLLFKQGLYPQAIDEFSKLIKLAPENADAYKNRGVSFMKQGKFDLAIEDFETAKALFPELRGLYSNLGVAWYYKKEYEKAIQSYDTEIEIAPENHIAYFNRALCLTELGRNTEAFEDLLKTLELKPNFYWAICYKADLLAKAGKDTLAMEAYEDAAQKEPKNSYALERLAKLKEKSGDKKPIEPETHEEKNTNLTGPRKMFTLQAGAFLNQTNADKMKTTLQDNGFESSILTLKDKQDRTWYLVRSGRYADRDEAAKARVALRDKMALKPVVRTVGDW